jgi:hypothetical protein
MAIVKMTFAEAINSITEEDHARALVLEAAGIEPDLTDPDAPEVTDEMAAMAFRSERQFNSINEEYAAMMRHFAGFEGCPVKKEKMLVKARRAEGRQSQLAESEEILSGCLVH